MDFNPKNGNFTGQIQLNTDIKKPTIIYVNEKFYYSSGEVVILKDDKGQVIGS